MKIVLLKKFVQILIAVLILGYGTGTVVAQKSRSPSLAPKPLALNIVAQPGQSPSLYVPLIGITSVPAPLALPEGGGNVTYNYAVKTFLREIPLTDVKVSDDKCSSIQFTDGDDDGNSRLDYGETWRYVCTTSISETTRSIATAIGTATVNTIATHRAYTTVVVGSSVAPPLVSIVNITKVASPLALPPGGGSITFTYRVNNPGVVPLSDVAVSDDKCASMSHKLGDTNGNDLLDTAEVWTYTCTMPLTKTTTNTATVTAFSNGFRAIGTTEITVNVETQTLPKAEGVPSSPPSLEPTNPTPQLPETGIYFDSKFTIWGILSGTLVGLITFYFLIRKGAGKV